MTSFWLNLILLTMSWFAALVFSGNLTTFLLFCSGLFFALIFIVPILNRKLKLFTYILAPMIVFIAFRNSSFSWLIYFALIFQVMTELKRRPLFIYMIYLSLFILVPSLLELQAFQFIFGGFLLLIIGTLVMYWKNTTLDQMYYKEKYGGIFQMYRVYKRQLSGTEKAARQEERNQIARDIHDNVGHRLTALTMQIEVARLKANDQATKEKLTELKALAQDSLKDTREAVNTLKTEETIGIQAIIQLIRKMESESQVNVSITMQAGVTGVSLNNDQSVAVYRAIQEALTNMMRHSETKNANLEFKVVADRDFRFVVSHKLMEKVKIQEGFGLRSMRERLEKINGRMTIAQTDNVFSIVGQFPLEVKAYD